MNREALMRDLRNRPAIYLGRRSLTCLLSFLDGVSYACARSDDSPEGELMRFQEWLRQKYNIHTTQGIERIVRFHSIDDRDAFDLFWVLYDEFRSLDGST